MSLASHSGPGLYIPGTYRAREGHRAARLADYLPSGLNSRPVGVKNRSRSVTNVVMEVVVPVGASRGIASGRGRASEWAHLDVSREHPV